MLDLSGNFNCQRYKRCKCEAVKSLGYNSFPKMTTFSACWFFSCTNSKLFTTLLIELQILNGYKDKHTKCLVLINLALLSKKILKNLTWNNKILKFFEDKIFEFLWSFLCFVCNFIVEWMSKSLLFADFNIYSIQHRTIWFNLHQLYRKSWHILKILKTCVTTLLTLISEYFSEAS